MENSLGRRVKFGRLTLLSTFIKVQPSGRKIFAHCICECGQEKSTNISNLRNGATVSCGCRKREVLGQITTKHGETRDRSKTVEYRAWCSMKERCSNSNHKSWEDYGGRGIKVCRRWLNSFENFLLDLGRKPAPTFSIDRINNNGNYTPSNCRWATRLEQRHNTRRAA